MGLQDLRYRTIQWLLFLCLGLSTPAMGSPEYRDWLTAQPPGIASHVTLDWTQSPAFAYPVTPGFIQPIVEMADFVTARTDPPLRVVTPASYSPPPLSGNYHVVEIRYYGVNFNLHLPTHFANFWTQPDIAQQTLSDAQQAAALIVARQIDSASQQYQWNHWDLLRLVERLSLELNVQVSPAFMQFTLLRALALDVQLARQEGQWLLLFSSKQSLTGLPTIMIDDHRYWIDQGGWLAPDSIVQLWLDPQRTQGSRLNVAPHPDSFYGSDWRVILLGLNGATLSVPVETTRIKAMQAMPQFSPGAYLTLKWPEYFDQLFQLAATKESKNDSLQLPVDRAARFVERIFPEVPEGDVYLLTRAIGMPVPQTVSLLRAFVLRQLLRSAGFRQVIAVEAGDIITLGIPESAESANTINLYGVPYRMLGTDNASALVHRTQGTIGLTKNIVHTLY